MAHMEATNEWFSRLTQDRLHISFCQVVGPHFHVNHIQLWESYNLDLFGFWGVFFTDYTMDYDFITM